jgi:hypothetical protein
MPSLPGDEARAGVVRRPEEGPYQEEDYAEEIVQYMTGMDVSWVLVLSYRHLLHLTRPAHPG